MPAFRAVLEGWAASEGIWAAIFDFMGRRQRLRALRIVPGDRLSDAFFTGLLAACEGGDGGCSRIAQNKKRPEAEASGLLEG